MYRNWVRLELVWHLCSLIFLTILQFTRQCRAGSTTETCRWCTKCISVRCSYTMVYHDIAVPLDACGGMRFCTCRLLFFLSFFSYLAANARSELSGFYFWWFLVPTSWHYDWHCSPPVHYRVHSALLSVIVVAIPAGRECDLPLRWSAIELRPEMLPWMLWRIYSTYIDVLI